MTLAIFTAVAKPTKSVDLFGSGDDEGDDDDSLFGAKAAKKTEQKAEPPKKKVYTLCYAGIVFVRTSVYATKGSQNDGKSKFVYNAWGGGLHIFKILAHFGPYSGGSAL